MMKKFLFLVLISMISSLSFAQMLTDDRVLEIIIAEKESGTSQQEIAAKLLKQGVTTDQLQRVRTKLEVKRYDESAVKDVKDAERVRKPMQDASEQHDALITGYAIDKVFGRNIFNKENLTFAPSMNIPTPANYVLGSGDVLIIDVWGASQFNLKETISPDGKIFIDGVGPVYLSGLTVAQAERHVKDNLGDVYNDSQVSVSLGSVRSIQVQLLGEIVAPGTYTISAFSTAFNALYAAGGINDMGTLRDIKICRKGKVVAHIDIYDYIINGKTEADVRLQDNDVISVGTYSNIVKVEGRVKRPMMYELKDDETLLDVISYAAGFAGDAYTENIKVTRKSGREYSMHTLTKSEAAEFTMKDGDVVSIDKMLNRFSNMIEITGAVFYPGAYELGDKIKTVRELLAAAGGVVEHAFLERAILQHRYFDRTAETVPIDLKGIIDGTAPDVPLKNNDHLFIPSLAEMIGEQPVFIDGEVNLPGRYRYTQNMTIKDVILQAGGLTRAASTMKVDVYRNILDVNATKQFEELSEKFTFTLQDGFVIDGGDNFILEPFDEVFVRRSPTYSQTSTVRIDGCVNYAGGYVMLKRDYRLSDLVKEAGGFTDQAYIKGASLRRTMTQEERKQNETVAKMSNIQMLEDALRNSGENGVNLALLDSLMTLKLNLRSVYPVAIDLEDAIENPGGLSDLVLRAGDVLTIPQYTQTVRVSGEVYSPSTVTFEKNKSVKYYIKHAGGFSNNARKRGVYIIYMNGDVAKVSKGSRKAVEPGCEIVVPRRNSKSRLSATEMATIGTSTASIATMIVAIINLLK